jgi:predicted hotdog family 3-hydroxylacyl-ACP dehydratase
MCLLDGVKEWDSRRISCVSRSHLDAGNPLRVNGMLSALCGIEYAAQAMAVHAGLTGDPQAKPRTGYLASLRDIECSRDRLDDLDGDLVVEAERLASEGVRVMYGFTVWIGKEQVLKGRAAVVLDAGHTDA